MSRLPPDSTIKSASPEHSGDSRPRPRTVPFDKIPFSNDYHHLQHEMSVPKSTNLQARIRLISAILLKIVVVGLILSIALMLLLRWIVPPTSAFMLRERLAGVHVHYRWVPLKQISPYAALAVISSEDQKFFDHWGLDLDAIENAVHTNKSRTRPRGASTISQQVVKNLFLWPGRSYMRKGFEVYFTLLMELLWSKQRILEVYLNIAEMGRGIFGVEAASRKFFNKSAAGLNNLEAATLAAILPNPKRMHADRPSDYVHRRTWQIVEQMDALGGRSFLKAAGL